MSQPMDHVENSQYKLQSRSCASTILVESHKTIVYSFVHQLEKQNKLFCTISMEIYDMCCMFYDCFVEILLEETSPFTILFAIFDLQFALLITDWTLLRSYKQCQFLKEKKLDEYTAQTLIGTVYDCSNITFSLTEKVQNDLTMMLLKYKQAVEANKTNDNVKSWTASNILISLIQFVVNNASEYHSQFGNLWKFVEYFRRYCRDIKYNGALFYNNTEHLTYEPVLIMKVCNQYNLQIGSFSNIGTMLYNWLQMLYKQHKFSFDDVMARERQRTGAYHRNCEILLKMMPKTPSGSENDISSVEEEDESDLWDSSDF